MSDLPQAEVDRISEVEQRVERLESSYDALTAKMDAWQQFLGQKPDLHERFRQLVEEWRCTRGHSSKIKDLVLNPAYQKIIGLGEPAIPLILKEMERRPDHWSWALTAISGEDPIPAEARGRLDQTASLWLDWGRAKSYQ